MSRWRTLGLLVPALVAGFFMAVGAQAQSCSGSPNANTVCAGPSSDGAAFPSFRGLVTADLPAIGNGDVLANTTGSSAPPVATPASTWFDTAYCNTVGYLIVRTTGAWTCSKAVDANPAWWGALCDGSNDDTAAIQAALNTGTNVRLPAGICRTSSALTLATKGQRFSGASRILTTLQPLPSFTAGNLITVATGETGPEITDLHITCGQPGILGIHAVSAQNANRTNLRNLRETLCGVGFDLRGSGGDTIDDVETWNIGQDFLVDGAFDVMKFHGIRSWPFDDNNTAIGGTGGVSSTTLTITGITAGRINVGSTLFLGPSWGNNGIVTVTAQTSGPTGGAGTYTLSAAQTIPNGSSITFGYFQHTAMFSGRCDGLFISNSLFISVSQLILQSGGGSLTGSISGTVMTVTAAPPTGSLYVGQTITGAGVTAGTTIVSLGTGVGGVGTYNLSTASTVGSETLTATDSNGTFGTIVGNDFDTYAGIAISAGNVSASGNIFSVGNAATESIIHTGGGLVVSASTFFNNLSTMVSSNTSTGQNTAYLAIDGSRFVGPSNTSPFVSIAGSANVDLSHNRFERNAGLGGSFMITKTGTGSRATIIGNHAPVDGTGNFISVGSDSWDRVVYNVTGAWTNSFPTPTLGVYSPQ